MKRAPVGISLEATDPHSERPGGTRRENGVRGTRVEHHGKASRASLRSEVHVDTVRLVDCEEGQIGEDGLGRRLVGRGQTGCQRDRQEEDGEGLGCEAHGDDPPAVEHAYLFAGGSGPTLRVTVTLPFFPARVTVVGCQLEKSASGRISCSPISLLISLTFPPPIIPSLRSE